MKTAHEPEMNPASKVDANASAQDVWMGLVAEQVKATRFGVVQIVVHDSRVVQIDHTERTRFSGVEVGKGNIAPKKSTLPL